MPIQVKCASVRGLLPPSPRLMWINMQSLSPRIPPSSSFLPEGDLWSVYDLLASGEMGQSVHENSLPTLASARCNLPHLGLNIPCWHPIPCEIYNPVGRQVMFLSPV